VVVPPEAWQPAELPAFLRLNFDVIDEEGMVLASGRDLQALRRELHLQALETFRRASKEEWEESGLTDWSCGELPPRVDLSEKGAMVHGFPALQDDGEAASVRIFPDAQSAEAAHHRGVLRLCALALAGHLKGLARSLPLSQEALLYHSSLGGTQEGLRDDIVRQAIDEILLAGQPEIRDPETFRRRVEGKRGAVSKRVYDLAKAADLTLREAYRVAQELNRENLPDDARRDMKQQLRHFAYPGFVIETSPEHARHVPRYLEAMRVRLERLRHSPHKDRRKLGQVEPVWHQCLEEMDRQKRGGRLTPELIAYRWMIEEFRVLLFAQELGPVGPCSEKRLAEQWERVRATRPPEA
jgi:ATP-dependent helicase HrpA